MQKRIIFFEINPSPISEKHLIPAFEQLGFKCILPFSFELRELRYPYCMTSKLNNNQKYWILYNTLKEYKNKFDYIFLNGAQYYYTAISDFCKKYNKKFIYWTTEDPILTQLTLPIVKQASLILSPAIECVNQYKELGLNAHLMMFGCNPNYHKIGKYNKEYDYDIILQASCYNHPARIEGFEIIVKSAIKLYEEGYSVGIYGAFWNSKLGMKYLNNHSEVYMGWHPNEDIPDICVSSKIILGVQCSFTSTTQQSMRSFEILSSKGFHLTQYVPSMDYWFKNEKHLISVKNKNDAYKKMKYYLDHKEERDIISEQGYNYVRNNHTYINRLNESVLPNLNF